METSPGYQHILEEGVQRGRQEGLKEGLLEGRQEGLEEGLCCAIRKIVMRVLESYPADLDDRLATLSAPDLDALLDRLNASPDADAMRAVLAELV